MSKRKYDEASVIRSLSRKASIRVDIAQKIIEVSRDNIDVGNGSWGKIDYLMNVHGYIQVFVNTINKKYVEPSAKNIISKLDKREQKLNMAKLTKNAMKKAKQ